MRQLTDHPQTHARAHATATEEEDTAGPPMSTPMVMQTKTGMQMKVQIQTKMTRLFLHCELN